MVNQQELNAGPYCSVVGFFACNTTVCTTPATNDNLTDSPTLFNYNDDPDISTMGWMFSK